MIEIKSDVFVGKDNTPHISLYMILNGKGFVSSVKLPSLKDKKMLRFTLISLIEHLIKQHFDIKEDE